MLVSMIEKDSSALNRLLVEMYTWRTLLVRTQKE